MQKNTENLINNHNLRDSGGKLIFENNILCSQFLRDYGDMDILRYIKPEDVEDVSERYVPLYSSERESDVVKRVNISKYLDPKTIENPLDLPIFIVSLLEHKTKVEYNVGMQILRYVIHIWEDYEREMNQKFPGISTRKDFCYPPILPIVYFEGKGNWTASQDIADRIFCGELMGKYLPHFQYQLVRLHDYSNEILLGKKDEISLAMMINKIQTPEDLLSFNSLSDAELNGILAQTPEHLRDLLAKLLRALLYSFEMPEDATESMVGKITERKMGRLFENQTINIPAMMREAEYQRQKIAQAQQELADVQDQLGTARETLDSTQEQLTTTQEQLGTTQEQLDAAQEDLQAATETILQKDTEIARLQAEIERLKISAK